MPITFTEEDFTEPKESSGITFSESDFEEKTPPPKKPYGRIRSFATLPAAPPERQPGEFAMLPIEEQRRIAEQQLDVPAPEGPSPGMLATMAREAGVSVIPTLAGAGGFTGGAILGEPAGPIASLAGGVTGSMLAGAAASDIQKAAAEAIAPEATQRFYEQLEAGREKYPIASTMARLAAAAPFFSVAAPKTAAELIKRGAVGAGISAIPAVTEGRLPTPAEAAEAAAFTAIYGEPRARALRTPIPMRGGEPNAIYQEANGAVRPVRYSPGEGAQQVPIERRIAEATSRRGAAPAEETITPEVQAQGRALDDLAIAQESTEAIVNRAKVGTERDAAFSERAAAAKRIVNNLQPGDIVGDYEVVLNEGRVGFTLKNRETGNIGEGVFSPEFLVAEIIGGEPVKIKSSTTGKAGESVEEKVQEKEAVRETVEPSGVAATAPEFTLTPAVEADGRVFTGMNHADAIVDAAKKGVDALDAEHKFLGSDGKFYNRKEAGAIYKQKTGKKLKFEEGLHSTELEQAGLLDHVKGPEEVTPAAKAPERVSPATAEAAPATIQPSAMAVGIAPPGTQVAQAAIASAGRTAQGIRALFKSNPTRKLIDQTFDAADNKANISGQQSGKSLRIGTNRLEREAAMAIVEANGDLARLAQFEAQVAGKDDRALAAVRYARQNWNRLQPLANKVSSLLDSQLLEENTNGINTEFHEGYVPHIYDQDLLMGRGRPYVLGGGGGKGIGTGFKKGRTFETVFDAIEAGYKPKSIDVADLVEHRVKVGNRLVNRKAWAESLKQAIDPTDGNPIVTDIERKQRGPGGSWYETAPPGYSIKEIIPGVKVAWHNGYSSLFDALTGTSRISGSLPGQIALQTAGGIKHGLLVFDTFHASRILQKELFLTGKVGYNKGKTLLEYADQDLNRAVQANEITQEMADWARANRPTANLLLDSGLNVGRVQEALYNSIVRQIPVLGHFNKWVFEKLTRGAMMESGLIEFERVKKAMPELSDKEVALKVSRDLNAYFGNLGRQGLFKSRQMQDVANLVALAPQWVESMARTEAYGAAQAVKGLTMDPILHKTILTGTIGKAAAQGLAAYFVGTQLLNLATRKQFTWDNQEEGHKLDAWIPDVTGKGNGFFISPFSVVAELTHDMLRYSHTEGNALKAAAKIASNKASPIWRAGRVFLEGVDYNKKRIDDVWARTKAAALALAPTPIPLQAALKTEYPGQAQRQISASLGFKTEPAESATQQMMNKANRFLEGIGKPRPTIEQAADEPSYNNLRKRLRVGDTAGAKEEIANLLKTRNRKQIGQSMHSSITHPFTGSKADEAKFLRSLTEEEKALYKKAKEERLAEYRRFLDVFKK